MGSLLLWLIQETAKWINDPRFSWSCWYVTTKQSLIIRSCIALNETKKNKNPKRKFCSIKVNRKKGTVNSNKYQTQKSWEMEKISEKRGNLIELHIEDAIDSIHFSRFL